MIKIFPFSFGKTKTFFFSPMGYLVGLSFLLLFVFFPKQAISQSLEIKITKPCDNSRIPCVNMVKGTVSDSNCQVWVLVHPCSTELWFPQKRATVRKNKTWYCHTYVGLENSPSHTGQFFELVALANPETDLIVNRPLDKIPLAMATSEIILVQRK